jgi:hypothetical protein
VNELVRRWRVVAATLVEGSDAEATSAVRNWIEEWDRRFWASDFSGFEEIYATDFRGRSRVPMVGNPGVDGPEGFPALREELSDVASRFWFDIAEVRRGGDGYFGGLGRMRARGRYSGLLMQAPWGVVWRARDSMLVEATAYMGHRHALQHLESAGVTAYREQS